MTGAGAFNIHLVSDSTGETVAAVTKAGASMFPGLTLAWHRHPFIRTIAALDSVFGSVRVEPGPIFHTMTDSSVIAAMRDRATQLGIDCVDVLTPVVQSLARILGSAAVARPGSQYRVDADYFDRVTALDYAMTNDDGLSAAHLGRADVILVGVSRTSKTPTCIYLAYQGVRAANVPLVPGQAPPDILHGARQAGVPVIGLTATPQRLAQIRRHRLAGLEAGENTAYADLDRIRDEVTEARLFFEKHAIPVVDVTRRSIEETAATIRVMIRKGAQPA